MTCVLGRGGKPSLSKKESIARIFLTTDSERLVAPFLRRKVPLLTVRVSWAASLAKTPSRVHSRSFLALRVMAAIVGVIALCFVILALTEQCGCSGQHATVPKTISCCQSTLVNYPRVAAKQRVKSRTVVFGTATPHYQDGGQLSVLQQRRSMTKTAH